MPSETVIIFGPTGHNGSIAATTAEEFGATVYLAMRDTTKAIPGLTPEREKAGSYVRVQADLNDPASVTRSVEKSGARRAFLYLVFNSPDHMLSTFQALKAGGIEFVVFLSSFSVQGDRTAFKPHQAVPYLHGNAELSLEKVFGQNYVAIRPGFFAANTLNWKKQIVGSTTGEIIVHKPDVTFDYITAVDMGRVAAGLLVHGRKGNETAVYLFGPEQVSQRDAVSTIARVMGREGIRVRPANEEERLRVYMEDTGADEQVAEYLLSTWFDPMPDGPQDFDPEWVENVRRYGGKPATTFQDWVEQYKGLFLE